MSHCSVHTFSSPSGTSTRLLKWKNTSVGRSTARIRPQLFLSTFTCGAGRRHTHQIGQEQWLCLHVDATELAPEAAGRRNRCCNLAMLHADSVHQLARGTFHTTRAAGKRSTLHPYTLKTAIAHLRHESVALVCLSAPGPAGAGPRPWRAGRRQTPYARPCAHCAPPTSAARRPPPGAAPPPAAVQQ